MKRPESRYDDDKPPSAADVSPRAAGRDKYLSRETAAGVFGRPSAAPPEPSRGAGRPVRAPDRVRSPVPPSSPVRAPSRPTLVGEGSTPRIRGPLPRPKPPPRPVGEPVRLVGVPAPFVRPVGVPAPFVRPVGVPEPSTGGPARPPQPSQPSPSVQPSPSSSPSQPPEPSEDGTAEGPAPLSARPLRTPAPAVTTIRVAAVPVEGFEFLRAAMWQAEPADGTESRPVAEVEPENAHRAAPAIGPEPAAGRVPEATFEREPTHRPTLGERFMRWLDEDEL
jgi:hypothetical protein